MLSESFPAQSRTSRVRRLPACLFLLTIFFLAGCGGSERVPPLASVKGKVTVDGAPVTAGQVTLAAEETPATPLPLSAGKIGPDGSYEIFTSGRAGAPLGKFKVRVSRSTVGEAGVPFDKKYSDPETSGLAFEVIASPEPGRYDLKLVSK